MRVDEEGESAGALADAQSPTPTTSRVKSAKAEMGTRPPLPLLEARDFDTYSDKTVVFLLVAASAP